MAISDQTIPVDTTSGGTTLAGRVASMLRSPWKTALLVWLPLSALLLVYRWSSLGMSLGDTDDAMRLVQWRAWLDGAGWYDLRISRLEPPTGLISHWSRLVDAGMAALYHLFALFLPKAAAETWMRAIWPLLWLYPAIAATLFMALRAGGRRLMIATAPVIFFAMQAHTQFMPGRIDHHNAQIALSLVTAASVLWAAQSATAALIGGISGGLMLAIGLENAPYLAAAGMIAAGLFVAGRMPAGNLGIFSATLALSSLAALGVSLPPQKWLTTTACDAMAMNIALPVAAGGLAMAVLALTARRADGPLRRLLILAPSAIIAGGLFAWLDPACLRGPFAHIDPAIRPIWLDNVKEAQGIAEMFAEGNTALIGMFTWPLLVLVAFFALRLPGHPRHEGRTAAIAAITFLSALSLLYTTKAIRISPYILWMTFPLAGAIAAWLWDRFSITDPARRILVAIAVSPLLMAVFIEMTAQALSTGAPHSPATGKATANQSAASAPPDDCTATSRLRALASLPAGRIAAPIDLGPHILALSHHEVLAAPYHRLSRGLTSNHEIFANPPQKAHEAASRAGVDYLVVCPSIMPTSIGRGQIGSSLWFALRKTPPATPQWLQPIPLPAAAPLRVFRVTPLRASKDG